MPVKKTTTTKKAGSGAAGAAKKKRGPKSGAKAEASGRAGVTGKAGVSGKSKVVRSAPRVLDGAAVAAARSAALRAVVLNALDDMKALEIKVLDVRGLTDVADTMVIASGTSDRHVRSVAQRLVEKTKEAGFRPHGIEGQQDSDWVLIDLSEMIVHVMLPRVREFYGLEKLWDMTATQRAVRA